MNRKKIIIWVLVIIAIAVVFYFVFKKPKDKTPAINITFPLKQKEGVQPGVENLQRYLNKEKGASLEVDGIWGDLTNAAALNLLKRDNISADIWQKWNLVNY